MGLTPLFVATLVSLGEDGLHGLTLLNVFQSSIYKSETNFV